jgi:alpha-beta hydrolase superfamily lysophospholipase
VTFPTSLSRRLLCGGAFLLLAEVAACAPPKPPALQPGTVISAAPFPGGPSNATAQRIVYASTAPDGSQIEVSALVVVPKTPRAPSGGRPVVAWLHPTTGIATACAPSQGPSPFGQIQGLGLFLSRGYIIVATDYPGLGTPGTHPYLVGVSEARAAVDSVRALQHLPDLQASNRFAVWGHSQGGHAALFVPDVTAKYAPDLHLVGVAAAAPVTDVAALLQQPGEDPLWGGLLSYTVASWSQVYKLNPADILPADGQPAVDRAAQECLETKDQMDQLLSDAAPLNNQPVTPGDAWRARMAENSPQPWASGIPAFIAQGARDAVVDPVLTASFAQRLCTAGIPVRYVSLSRGDHYTAGVRSAGAAAAWISDRFADRSPKDDCGRAPLR